MVARTLGITTETIQNNEVIKRWYLEKDAPSKTDSPAFSTEVS